MADPLQSSNEPQEAATPALRRETSRAIWAIAGGGMVFLLLLVWLMPVASGDALGWVERMLGLSPDTSRERVGLMGYRTQFLPTTLSSLPPVTLAVLSVSALAASLKHHRRRAGMLVLGHLAAAVRLGLPLPVYLRAAASGEAKPARRRLVRLAASLEQGRSVGQSLQATVGELPPLLIDRITAAERSSVLPASLDAILEGQRQRHSMTGSPVHGRAYLVVMASSVVVVAWMISVFVLPKFSQIFANFKVELPPATRALAVMMNAHFLSNAVLPQPWPLLLLVLLIFLLFLTARATRGLFTSRPQQRLFAGLQDRLIWYTPVWGSLTRNHQTSLVCEALAEALLAGRPLPAALATATLPSLNTVLRNRLRMWRVGVESGRPLAMAAQDARMPSLLCDLLAGAQTDAAGAIIFAGRAYAAASGRLAAVLSAVAPVLVTAVMAVVVTFLAMALLVPLIRLSDAIR
ncbi:MAG TPA: type II secretion system F family protein [Tepidisphaeraceae bacterium]